MGSHSIYKSMMNTYKCAFVLLLFLSNASFYFYKCGWEVYILNTAYLLFSLRIGVIMQDRKCLYTLLTSKNN
jgi:hypothetical protein